MSKINFEGDAVANLEQTGLESVAELLREQLRLESVIVNTEEQLKGCLLYTSPSPRDRTRSRMPSSA